ncbi:MAG: CoB--CoM heterodisulfide reductase iron-sulfur subunit B family protein [Armatimonadetes bacterium]|nr:CoB--CoM heterodisulfide reductase iron-sulfur subunit B family protein [Armatimonadota bacterium]
MRYAYYPGCSLHSTARDYNLSTLAVCKQLGIELVEIPDWNCCGATSAHALNRDLSIALPLRNLAIAETMGLDVIAPCAACFNRMKSSNVAVNENPELLARMSDLIGMPYSGKVKVLPLLAVINEIGTETIREHVKRLLENLKVAPYYGCLLVRPPETTEFDDPEDPQSLDNLITALGAEVVKWPYKTECCGAGLSISKTEVVLKLTHDILSMAKRAGANCLATACPLCQSNLDLRQSDVEKAYGEKYGLPAFYFTQLMGIAFGLPGTSLGLDKLMVSPEQVLTTGVRG